MVEMMEVLSRIGVGGFYRRTVGPEGEEIKGPYPKRGQANPYGAASLPSLSVSSEFHLRKPQGAVPPDPAELTKFEKP